MGIKNILLLLLLLSMGIAAQESKLKIKEIISLLEDKIKVSEKQFLKKEKYCASEAKNNKIQFDWNTTKVNKKEIRIASHYLVGRNMHACSYEEEQQLIYDLSALIFFKKYEHLNFEQETSELYIIFLGANAYLDSELNYLTLPKKSREYMETVFGNIPYGLEAIKEFTAEWRKLKP